MHCGYPTNIKCHGHNLKTIIYLGKDGSGSTVWGGHTVPRHSFDGDPFTFFATRWETNPWFLGDMEQPYHIVGAVITNRVDCCEGEWSKNLSNKHYLT